MAWLFIIASVFVFYMVFSEDNSSKYDRSLFSSNDRRARNLKSSEIEQVVNKHLSLTRKKQEMEQMKVEIDNFKAAPALSNSMAEESHEQDSLYGVDFNHEDPDYWVGRDLTQMSRRYSKTAQSPSEKIQAKLAEKQWTAEYQESYNAAYIEAFLENARRAGYHVELTSDFKVKSVRRIKKDRAIPIFGDHADGEMGSSPQ